MTLSSPIIAALAVGAAVLAQTNGQGAYAIIRDFGFPAAVALILLLRLDSRLAELTRTIERQTAALIRHGVDLPDNDRKA